MRMRARAQELGLSDAEVARRLGIAQSRYANYISGLRAPDFGTFLRICATLSTTPSILLGVDEASPPATKAERLRERIVAAIGRLDEPRLRTALTVVDAMASEG